MAAEKFRYRVEGMDCPSCAAKIENAVGRLDGVSSVQLNFGAERLTLSAQDAALPSVEAKIRALGFKPRLLDGGAPESGAKHDHAHHDCPGHSHRTHDGNSPAAHDHAGPAHYHDPADDIDAPWWQKPKARLAFGLGAALALAWGASHLLPAHAQIFYVFATAIGLIPFGRRAAILAVSGTPFSIELLMVVAALGAILIGEAAEASLVVFLFAVGELLENVAAGRARAGIKALADLVPRTALVRTAAGDRETPVEALTIGDIIVIRPGDRIGADGEIVEGRSDVDQSPITGESAPVAKETGADVSAGSINATGTLLVRVTRKAADNTIARIVHMVEEAQSSKAPFARFIERFSTWYTPGAMAVAALVILVPPLALGWDWDTWIYRGLALLLIACPCALVISTPAAIASGLSAGARRGLLIKGGAPLEIIGHLKTAAFDKTGTLTRGKPVVTDVIGSDVDEDELLRLAAAVERGSSHPTALAILAATEERAIAVPTAENTITHPGRGIGARVGTHDIAIGSPLHIATSAPLGADDAQRIAALEEDGKTVVILTRDGVFAGLIAVRDEPREDTAQAIRRLRELGIRPVMLTGDNERTGRAIAARLGIDVEAQLLPHEKLARINALKADGPVAMIGDGINDAPALAAASVGVAMGGGTDVALETADAALLHGRVSGIPQLVELSRATMSNVRQNVALALGLKAVFLVTTLTGSTSLWMAILADTGATVLVTANALRLLAWKKD